mmetsp:Transcript_54917/g.91154  ORF Transcript_54917/g.91154 Transcript_54917/m.91154 type:complete len:244 (+) Transcript_54917:420-1151(+)
MEWNLYLCLRRKLQRCIRILILFDRIEKSILRLATKHIARTPRADNQSDIWLLQLVFIFLHVVLMTVGVGRIGLKIRMRVVPTNHLQTVLVACSLRHIEQVRGVRRHRLIGLRLLHNRVAFTHVQFALRLIISAAQQTHNLDRSTQMTVHIRHQQRIRTVHNLKRLLVLLHMLILLTSTTMLAAAACLVRHCRIHIIHLRRLFCSRRYKRRIQFNIGTKSVRLRLMHRFFQIAIALSFNACTT